MSPLTKKQRRQANFGKRNTVRSYTQRKYHGSLEHAAPQSRENHRGDPWPGWSGDNPRKPSNKRESWRDWMRAHPVHTHNPFDEHTRMWADEIKAGS